MAGDPVLEGVLDGGPRARIPASPGLKRAANFDVGCWTSTALGALAVFTRGLSSSGLAEIVLERSLVCTSTAGVCFMLLCLAKASGVASRSLPSEAEPRALSVRPNSSLFARASGFAGGGGTSLLIFRS